MIHIEIGKSYAGLIIRIGDCEGSTEFSNTDKKTILRLISDEIDRLEMSARNGEAFSDGNPINTSRSDLVTPLATENSSDKKKENGGK